MQADTTIDHHQAENTQVAATNEMAETQVPKNPQVPSQPIAMLDFWIPLIGSLFAIVLGVLNWIRTVRTDHKFIESQRENDFDKSVDIHRRKLLSKLANFQLAVQAIQSAPEGQKQSAQESLTSQMGAAFSDYQESYSALRVGHQDWAIIGKDPSLPENLQDLVVDKVFCWMDALAYNEQASTDELVRLQGRMSMFSDAIVNAIDGLKRYRDECCPRLNTKRKFLR